MLWLLATILLLVWIVALAFKVTAGFIHVLLIAALAVFLWSFLRGRRQRTTVP
jgi:hypothetical protein